MWRRTDWGSKWTSETVNRNQVTFRTENSLVQAVFDAAEKKAKNNLVDFCGKRVLVEGGEYRNLWLETQPMGGEMYAKRDAEAGFHNIDLFMRAANEEGMMPGMVSCVDGIYREHHNFIQGYCFPIHALNLYYIAGLDRSYLERLYRTLERYDAWLWSARESDGDGCLEAWCPCDTGEDYAAKFFDAPHFWEAKEPPGSGQYHFPRASMDLMGYSCDGRQVLAKVSAILENGKASYWNEQAMEIRRKIRSYLWREDRGACFDRDENHAFLDILTHNNLRVMYHGAFGQDMADRFLAEHLFNKNEFWTRMPLPSTAVNDPMFRNVRTNNWSGQPEGLTFQRAIRALENYGHLAELPLLAERLFHAVGEEGFFPQQFDPFTAEPSRENNPGDYGPTLLACLEYISRLYGIHQQEETVYWGCYGNECARYTQTYGERNYLCSHGETVSEGFFNGKKCFSVTRGFRVETNLDGAVQKIINISAEEKELDFSDGTHRIRTRLSPNAVVIPESDGYRTHTRIPFAPKPEALAGDP